jgi:tRNA (cytidine32/uridine32-2'-O)-methyltransferase
MNTVFPVRFVLFAPMYTGNIGSVARAMKTMGFADLVLVNPPPEFPNNEARQMASAAQDVLAGARVVPTLADAVAGCGLVVGSSARYFRLGVPELDPRQCAAQVQSALQTQPVALVFGPERSGLTNAELDLCHALVYIPANPDYNSLNLAQAVQLIAYELRMAAPFARELPPPESPLAEPADLQLFYEHLERVLLGSGFLDPANPRHLMRRLRRLFNRTRLDANELNILRGILSALVPGSGDRPPNSPASGAHDG